MPLGSRPASRSAPRRAVRTSTPVIMRSAVRTVLGSAPAPLAKHLGVDPRQRLQIVQPDILVDLMGHLIDQPALDDRAEVFDEARVRGASGGAQLGPSATDLFDCGH